MCGFVGNVGAVDPAVLDRMTIPRAPAVRRPGVVDERTRRIRPPATGDPRPSGGAQPFLSGDDSIVVVFNGEIYNHPTLRRELTDLGCRYRTRSDTESIVHAWTIWGPKCVEHLDGMFAFVLFDRNRRVLFARATVSGKSRFISRSTTTRGAGPTTSVRVRVRPRALTATSGPPSPHDGLVVRRVRSYLLNDYPVGTESLYENVSRLGAVRRFCTVFPVPTPRFRVVEVLGFSCLQRETLARDPRYRVPGVSVPELERELETELLETSRRGGRAAIAVRCPAGVAVVGRGGFDDRAGADGAAAPATGIDTFSIGFRRRRSTNRRMRPSWPARSVPVIT